MALGRTDPELARQLDEAKESGEPVQAVVKLRRTAGKAPVPSVMEEQTRRAVDRTTRTTGEEPDDVHVLGRLATAYVSGSEKFLREFVEQPEVVSAVANQAGSPRPAPAPGPDNRFGGSAATPASAASEAAAASAATPATDAPGGP